MSYSYKEMKALEAENRKWINRANEYQTLARAANEAQIELNTGRQRLRKAQQCLGSGIWSGPDAEACRRTIAESCTELEKYRVLLQQTEATMTKKEQEARERASEIARKLVNEVYADLDLAAKVRVTVDSVTGNVSVASRS